MFYYDCQAVGLDSQGGEITTRGVENKKYSSLQPVKHWAWPDGFDPCVGRTYHHLSIGWWYVYMFFIERLCDCQL